MLKKFFKQPSKGMFVAATAAAAVMTAVAGPAAALEQGQCLPYDQAVAQLRTEGQRSLITAEKIVPGAPNTALVIYSSNDNGTKGYEIGGDRRAGQTLPDRLCVRAILSDIRLNNAFNQTIPASFYLSNTVDPSEIPAIARRMNVGGYGHHNLALDEGASNGSFPALQARIVGGPLLTVRMGVTQSGGTSARSFSSGIMIGTDAFSSVAYTPYALEVMRGGPTQVAALRP